MREIKFRGKRLDNGEWAVGSLLVTDDNKNNPMQSRMPKKRYQIVEYCAGDWNMGGWDYVDVDSATVGQFTGLKDKNGKEIFEGDIVKWSDFNSEVLFKNGCFTLKSVTELYRVTINWEVEVTGNIHDNPEPLKTN